MMLTNPITILGENKVTGIRCVQMMLSDPDESGRRRPVPMDGSEFNIVCDQIIIAIGQGSNPLIARMSKLAHDINGNIIVDEDMATSIEGVFAGGDIIGGDSTVIQAMGHGKKVARAIDSYLRKDNFV